MRIVPRSVKGKIRAALLGVTALVTLALVLLVVLWTWLSYVLVAAFLLFGAVVVLLALGLVIYLVWKRRNLTALRVDWKDREADSHP